MFDSVDPMLDLAWCVVEGEVGPAGHVTSGDDIGEPGHMTGRSAKDAVREVESEPSESFDTWGGADTYEDDVGVDGGVVGERDGHGVAFGVVFEGGDTVSGADVDAVFSVDVGHDLAKFVADRMTEEGVGNVDHGDGYAAFNGRGGDFAADEPASDDRNTFRGSECGVKLAAVIEGTENEDAVGESFCRCQPGFTNQVDQRRPVVETLVLRVLADGGLVHVRLIMSIIGTTQFAHQVQRVTQ